MEIDLRLGAQNWSDRTPTKTQLENHMGDLSSYLNKLAGALLATGEFTIADQPIATVLNAAAALKAAKEQFAGATTSGIVTPRPQPQMVPRSQ
jgi:hypothetical protein